FPFRSRLLRERLEKGPLETCPDPVLAPFVQPAPAGGGAAILAGQVAPATAGPDEVEDAVEGAPILHARTPTGRARWDHRADDCPLGVRQRRERIAARFGSACRQVELAQGVSDSLFPGERLPRCPGGHEAALAERGAQRPESRLVLRLEGRTNRGFQR